MCLDFWSFTNARDGSAAYGLAGQLHACEAVLHRRPKITGFHYQTPAPISTSLPVARRAAAGPPRSDGHWTQLASAVAAADRGFRWGRLRPHRP
jgi:hypothetical protein